VSDLLNSVVRNVLRSWNIGIIKTCHCL
jgi:hypothetical protein